MASPTRPSSRPEGIHDQPAHPARPGDRMPLQELVAQVRQNGRRLREADPALWVVVEHLLDALEEGRS